MLRPEEAKEQLKKYYRKDFLERRQLRILLLPISLQGIANNILRRFNPLYPDAQDQAYQKFFRLKPEQQRKILKALLPKIADEALATWQLFDLLPFQTGMGRRPFRIKNPAQGDYRARAAWLDWLIMTTQGYDQQDVVWLAAWAPYLNPDTLGYLFAGAIQLGGSKGQQIYEILIASARGEHPIGAMGRHVVRGLLCAENPAGWEFVERLLLAAQREEGLRQVILESIDEAHPRAFRRLFHLILDKNLTRFSATIRAVDVWFGLGFEAASQHKVEALLQQTAVYMDSSDQAVKALSSSSAQENYLALWTIAIEDAHAALTAVLPLLQDGNPERRFVATHLLAQLALPESLDLLIGQLDDPDLHIAARAFSTCATSYFIQSLEKLHPKGNDLFEHLEALIARLDPKRVVLKPIVWDWFELKLKSPEVADLLVQALGKRPPTRLLPYVSKMSEIGRGRLPYLLDVKDARSREVLLQLTSDSNVLIRQHALERLKRSHIQTNEAEILEASLTRKPADLRRGLLTLLLSQKTSRVLESAARLLEKNDENQRLAGLELLRRCAATRRSAKACRVMAARYQADHPRLSATEQNLIDQILDRSVVDYTLKDALGLMDPNQRTRPTPPRTGQMIEGIFGLGSPLVTRAALGCIHSLDQLIDQYRDENITIQLPNERERDELLGNLHILFPTPNPNGSAQEDSWRLPLREVWESWWKDRSDQLRDPDGLEILRALAPFAAFGTIVSRFQRQHDSHTGLLKQMYGMSNIDDLHYPAVIRPVLLWLSQLHPVRGEADGLLDSLERSFAAILPVAGLESIFSLGSPSGSRIVDGRLLGWWRLVQEHQIYHSSDWRSDHYRRLWGLLRWLDEPMPGMPRLRPELRFALSAYEAGAANQHDLLDILLGERKTQRYATNQFNELRTISGRKPGELMQRFPVLVELAERCRERILEVELQRGETATAATLPAMNLRYIPGVHHLMRLLTALGKTGIDRGQGFSLIYGENRAAVLSHLIRASFPAQDDTPEDFAHQADENEISEKRLIELAIFAPQWATFAEHALGWPKFAEGVWWVYAHTKDRQWSVDQETRELWVAQVSEYTPLTAENLMDGAVDVAWFRRLLEELGEERWEKIYRSALFASSGTGHTRARQFADAMLQKVTVADLAQRIQEKRHQDSVRALGLVPLHPGDGREDDLLQRYEIIREFQRSSKKYGSQRQASEKLAAEIALENLARTAGYPDAQRLEWAMELASVADLIEGPVTVTAGETRVSLSIDELGEPQIEVRKNDKALKSVPDSLKKHEAIAELLERKRRLTRQASRMRLSLEQAMCRGDLFHGGELQNLLRHPVLRPMLEQIVFISSTSMGYLVENGCYLQDATGKYTPLPEYEQVQIAHPYDLLKSEAWHIWQHECFVAERIQPFKQIFRELYVLTDTEKQDGGCASHRYTGHQVQPKQALALFGSRGWVTDPEEGVRRTFHDLSLTAHISFANFAFTPGEIEGLTIDSIHFTRRGEWIALLLEDIPARVFSEIMRDVDLVVSVAHAGGVDPEATASTVESRAMLLRETLAMLKIDNVRIQNNHALIDGKLSHYSLHLGSAVVHKQPGGALCIVPVHSQQRGRIFLPFADNDPRTAEVLSKAILLAHDDQIKDPVILEQILRNG